MSLSFALSLVLHFCSLFCTLTSLFNSPSFLSNFPRFCALLHSIAFCLFLFSTLSLSLGLSLFCSLCFTSFSQLSCSGIVPDHSTSKCLLLTAALCSPHLDHVIFKSEGTALLFSMSACFTAEEKETKAWEGGGRVMSPTSEPARWMHFD